MSSAPVLRAWVDESIRLDPSTNQSGIYILAATVTAPTLCDSIRAALRELLVGKSRRLHWRTEKPIRRALIAETVSSMPLTHIAIIGEPVDPGRQERARRICMERLYFELGNRGIRDIDIERRDAALNRRDMTMLNALRRTGAVDNSLHINFGDPYNEPMLWLPDIIGGIIGSSLRRGESKVTDAIGKRIEQIHIQIR